MRTTLESGAWVEHLPVQDLRYGHKRALERAGKLALGPGVVDEDGQVDMAAVVAGLDVKGLSAARQDALWAMVITGWSYDLPVPQLDKASGTVTGAEAFDDLPLGDAEEIEMLLQPFAEKLGRRPDPKSSITSGSNGSPRAAANGSRRG